MSYNWIEISWLQNSTSLHFRIDVALIQETKLGQEDPTPRSSAKRTPPHEYLALTLCILTEMAVAQDSTEAVVSWSTSTRSFSTLYYRAQPLFRWNSRSLSTWIGDVHFPLLTSTCPHIVLTTPPTNKMTSRGSIIYQNSLASSVGNLMLITVPGMIMCLQTLRAWHFTIGWKHTQGFC